MSSNFWWCSGSPVQPGASVARERERESDAERERERRSARPPCASIARAIEEGRTGNGTSPSRSRGDILEGHRRDLGAHATCFTLVWCGTGEEEEARKSQNFGHPFGSTFWLVVKPVVTELLLLLLLARIAF